MTKGKLDQLTEDERQLITLLRRLSPVQRKAWIELMERWVRLRTGARCSHTRPAPAGLFLLSRTGIK